MSTRDDEIDDELPEYEMPELMHQEYFCQFENTIRKFFKPNEAITLYRTCKSLPCSANDKLARMFRPKDGQDPITPIFTTEELAAMTEAEQYKQVTKAALSFNTSAEAAIASAKKEDRKRLGERNGKKKSEKYRADRGCYVGKFDFPQGKVLISEIIGEHGNILVLRIVDIEDYRDKSFEITIDYDDNEDDN